MPTELTVIISFLQCLIYEGMSILLNDPGYKNKSALYELYMEQCPNIIHKNYLKVEYNKTEKDEV